MLSLGNSSRLQMAVAEVALQLLRFERALASRRSRSRSHECPTKGNGVSSVVPSPKSHTKRRLPSSASTG